MARNPDSCERYPQGRLAKVYAPDMPFEPRIPDGQHLGESRYVDGAFVGHLFDDNTNKLVGHAAWEWVDEPDSTYGYSPGEPKRELTPEEIAQAIEMVALIIAATVKFAIFAQPHIKRWWVERVVPFGSRVRAGAGRLIRRRPAGRPKGENQLVYVATRTGVEVAIDREKLRMSSSEWESRFQLMLAAAAVKDEQLRVLSNALIDDSSHEIESGQLGQELSPREFADRVMRALIRNPALVNDETANELARAFSAVPESARQLRQLEQGKYRDEL